MNFFISIFSWPNFEVMKFLKIFEKFEIFKTPKVLQGNFKIKKFIQIRVPHAKLPIYINFCPNGVTWL